MAILGDVFWSQWKGNKGLGIILNTNVGLIVDSDDVVSTKGPHFFRGFQILSRSHFATPLASSPLSQGNRAMPQLFFSV